MSSSRRGPPKSASTRRRPAKASGTPAPKAQRRYRLEFLESALREWRALDGSIREVLKKHLAQRLETPHFPGSELHGPLAGCYKIKLRAQGYRLVYQVRDEVMVVLVIAVDRRDKDKVYRAALARMDALRVQEPTAPSPTAASPRTPAPSRARRSP